MTTKITATNFTLTSELWHACVCSNLDLVVQNRGPAFTENMAAAELSDRSGGRGLTPDFVPRTPTCGSLVGFSGGIGPNTVADYLAKILGDGPFWIDMEGQIRTNGWFDLDLVEDVCRKVYGDSMATGTGAA